MTISPLPPPKLETVNDLFAAALQARPDDVFVDMAGEQVSFRAADRTIDTLAHGLRAFGIGKGDAVCALADTSLEILLLWFAANRLGAIWVPLNSALKGEFLRHQIEDSRARLMIVEDHYADRVALIAEKLESLAALVVRGDGPADPIGRLALRPWSALAGGGSAPPAHVPVSPHDVSMIIYTSGTTGPSKGCIISHNYICAYARQMAWAIGLRPGDVLWFALPLFHLGGLGAGVVGGLRSGARVAIAPRFSVSGFWPDIERSGATVVLGVGPTATLIAEAPDSDAMRRCHGQVRTLCAAPLAPVHQQKWRERFGVRYAGAPGYGLTEASMVTLHPIAAPSPPGSSGRRTSYIEIRIADEEGMECPPNRPGRILIRPNARDVMFAGYWGRPEATLAALQDLWFDTGDIGKFDEDGFFYFVDRAKDYLRRRGENISSYEVETTFRAHPAIADVAVHAVRSALGEDDLKATIMLKEGAAVTEEEICRWSVDRLPYYAVPQFIEFRAELPRNPVGRVLKYQLRDEGVTPATWDRASSPDIQVRR